MGAGLLSTAGGVVFAGDSSKHVLALDANNGQTLWHATMGGGNQMNGAITYELDGRQYVVVGGGDSLYAYALPAK
jgi:alcohol dehydrogenase (cytochrome c)